MLKLQVIILFNVSAKRPRLDTVDLALVWKTNRRRAEMDVPLVEDLRKLVQLPLNELEKTPLTDSMFESLVGKLAHGGCSMDDARSLFKIGDFDADYLDIYQAAFKPPPNNGGTEYSFVHFWDTNIRDILLTALPDGRAIRNNNLFTSTRLHRPDFAFMLNQICVFRGEEKGPDVLKDPEVELTQKLVWIYNPAPYILAYYCVGTSMTLTAITAPAPGKKPGRHDIITIDLHSRANRIANVRHLINLSPLLPLLANLVPSGVSDLQEVQRPNSTITFYPTQVVKSYQCKDAVNRVKHLKEIYNILEKHSIPNTDKLVHSTKTSVFFEPRDERELWQCLVCILNALTALHKIPLYHRDIRWPNVLRKIDDESKWFLIDFEDAATPPTAARISFTKEEHSPAIFQDDHGSEVDIWGVGYLIQKCAIAHTDEWRMLGEDICNRSAELRAEEVLTLLNNTPKDM